MILDILRYAVGAEDGDGAVGNVADFLDENRAFRAQGFDNAFVVNDFVAHIDGRAEPLDCPLDDLDGALNTRAEAARLGEDDMNDAFVAFRHMNIRPITVAPGNN